VYLILWTLLACEAGIELPDAPDGEVSAPSGSAAAPDATVPEEGPPSTRATAEEERLAAARAAARAQQPQVVVVPEGERERAWEWEFEYKGPTRRQHLDDEPTFEEMQRIEREQAEAAGVWDG